METYHNEDVCPHCGVKLFNEKLTNEAQIKRLITANKDLNRITEGVYAKEYCPHYYNVLKTTDIKASIVIICYENAYEKLKEYKEALNCELVAIATHCIGVLDENVFKS